MALLSTTNFKLTRFALNYCNRLTDATLEHIGKYGDGLEDLYLSSLPFKAPDKAMESIAKGCVNLTQLRIGAVPTTDITMGYFAKGKQTNQSSNPYSLIHSVMVSNTSDSFKTLYHTYRKHYQINIPIY